MRLHNIIIKLFFLIVLSLISTALYFSGFFQNLKVCKYLLDNKNMIIVVVHVVFVALILCKVFSRKEIKRENSSINHE